MACSVYKVPLETPIKIKQIYMTNDIAFVNGSHIKYVGSAFLIEHLDKIYACTAKHIVEKSRYIKPPVRTPEVNEGLDAWTVFPRKQEKPIMQLDSLINDEKSDSEWWVFELEKPHKKVQRLKVRTSPVKKGESVFFVGCPYKEKDCVQNIYVGEVSSTTEKMIGIKYEPMVNVAGFSGGPLLDANGELIGLLCQASFDKKKGVHTFIKAENTDYLLEILSD